MRSAAALLCLAAALPCSAKPHVSHVRGATPAATVPQLGDDVPATLLKRASSAKTCPIGDGHSDPCATVSVGHDRVTVAWDAATHRVTYLYSTTLDTDTDIRAGDVLAIDPDSPITPFPAPGQPHRFVTTDWCDTAFDLTGDAEWCAVMLPTRPRSGKVIGFVQSLYLYLPEFDSEPLHRSSHTLRGLRPGLLLAALRRSL